MTERMEVNRELWSRSVENAFNEMKGYMERYRKRIEEGEIKEEYAGMRDVWCCALSWFLKPPSSKEKREKQAILVETIKKELKAIDNVEDLHGLYCCDSRWCLEIARAIYPREWTALGLHAATAAAYGIRFTEIMIREKGIDATTLQENKNLAKLVGEWAIW